MIEFIAGGAIGLSAVTIYAYGRAYVKAQRVIASHTEVDREVAEVKAEWGPMKRELKKLLSESEYMANRLEDCYEERNNLVLALSKIFPSCIGLDSDAEHLEWSYVVAIDLPTGQVTWHVHADKIDRDFQHLEINPDFVWDGHTTEEKYERLAALPVFAQGPIILSEAPQDNEIVMLLTGQIIPATDGVTVMNMGFLKEEDNDAK